MTGPVLGVIELSAEVVSLSAFRSWNVSARRSKEFVFDCRQSRLVLGTPVKHLRITGSPHQQLAVALAAADADLVGGGIQPSGEKNLIRTNEASGHYGTHWDPGTRARFYDFLAGLGFVSQHDSGPI